MKRHYALALLITAPFGLAATAATVDGPDSQEIRTETVRYQPEMRDHKSLMKLFFGIRQAAEEVCSISSHPVGYEIWDERACEAKAVAQAVREAGIPALEDYYFGPSRQVVASTR